MLNNFINVHGFFKKKKDQRQEQSYTAKETDIIE